MMTPRGRIVGLGLALALPLLAGCHMPNRQVDSSRYDNSAIRDDVRKQEIQRQLDESSRMAADAARAQMAAQAAAQSFRH
jgi:hypothetical protein